MIRKKISFDEEIYGKLSINQLILFSIHKLESKKRKCSFGNLIEVCFTSFPKAFGFEELSQWPDSRKLDRPLRSLRNKKLIKGGPKTSFSLTDLGKKKTKDIVRVLTQKKLL